MEIYMSSNNRKDFSKKIFHLTDDEYDTISDKFGLFMCSVNCDYDDYHGLVNRSEVDKYHVIDMLKEQTINKQKVGFWCRSIIHINHPIENNLF